MTTSRLGPAIDSKITADAQAFVEGWSKAWNDHDGHAYAALLHEDCVLYNPFRTMGPADLPEFIDSLLANWPDHTINATRWGPTGDGVIFEWVATGTLPGGPIEVRGVDRYTLREGKAIEGESYFDPRLLFERQQAPADT